MGTDTAGGGFQLQGGSAGFQPPNPYPPEDIESGKTMAVLSIVLSPAWIIPLVTRDNAFALYHAKQAAVLTIIGAVAGLILTGITFVTCGVGGFLMVALLVLLYPWIVGLIAAAQGKYEPMPLIGQFAEQWFSGIQADKRPGALPPGGQQ